MADENTCRELYLGHILAAEFILFLHICETIVIGMRYKHLKKKNFKFNIGTNGSIFTWQQFGVLNFFDERLPYKNKPHLIPYPQHLTYLQV